LKLRESEEEMVSCYLFQNWIERSTFFAGQRVAKASQGLFPPPFLITFQKVYELQQSKGIKMSLPIIRIKI